MLADAKKDFPKIKAGEEIEIPLVSKQDYGRIAAQNSKAGYFAENPLKRRKKPFLQNTGQKKAKLFLELCSGVEAIQFLWTLEKLWDF